MSWMSMVGDFQTVWPFGFTTDQLQEPIFFSVPNTDKLFMPEQRSRTVEILTSGKKRFNMQIFSDVGHGFAVS